MIFSVLWERPEGEQNFLYPVPRFRRRGDTVKIQTVNGLRVEIFARKYHPSIDSLNRLNGNESRLLRGTTSKNCNVPLEPLVIW